MNKNIFWGTAAFGGILLIALVLPKTKNIDDIENTSSSEEAIIVLSQDFSSFPIYPNANIKNINDVDGEKARDASVSLSTFDSKNNIHEWYREALSVDGWSIKSDKNVAGYQIIQGEKQNLYTSLQVAGGAEDGELIISQQLKIRKQ